MSTRRGTATQTADSQPFDPGTTDLTSTETGPAIRELATTVGVSASPGYQYGRSGTVTQGTYLNVVGGVPSNRAGITVALTNPVITQVYVACQDLDTFQVEIFEHDGNEQNIQYKGFVQMTNQRAGTFTVNIPITSGRQLATRTNFGTCKNLNVGLQLQGSAE